MKLRTAARIVCLLVCSLAAVSCSSNAPNPQGGASPPGGGADSTSRPKIAFITNNASDFWAIANAGTDKAAQEFNADVDFRMPARGTAAEQQEIIEDLLAKGVQGIAISPKDAVNQAEFLNGIADRVPLITQDSDLPQGSKRLCYIGTHNEKAGQAAGEMIKEALPSGGKFVIFVGTLDAQNAVDRRQGLANELAGMPVELPASSNDPITLGKYTLLETMTDETDRPKCKANVEDALVKYPDVACFVGLWAYNPPLILQAVKEGKKEGQVKIIAFDEEDETLQGVKDGHIYCTIVQQPYEFGYQSVRLLASLARGDKSVIPPDGLLPVPHKVIKRDNVEEFHAELRRLRGQ
jgi:ribose transport system substrate-binding protein